MSIMGYIPFQLLIFPECIFQLSPTLDSPNSLPFPAEEQAENTSSVPNWNMVNDPEFQSP